MADAVFVQVLKLIDRHALNTFLKGPYQPWRKLRTLSQWGQCTSMMFAQLTGRASPRDICDSWQTQAGRLYHLGMRQVKNLLLPIPTVTGLQNSINSL